ncbi:MAG: hypothetical protein J0M33_13535 [Anaerolineae bacterium]|nr:hypothetical protein [Anaerolineae bacterium]
MKRSGLADSPFFAPTPSREVFRSPPASPSPVDHIRHLYEKPVEHLNERTDEQMNKRTPEHLNERTDEQMNERTPEHLNERTVEQPHVVEKSQKLERPIHRQSFDLYDDQAQAIDALCLKWRKERGHHITKGEAIRELLDAILPSKI